MAKRDEEFKRVIILDEKGRNGVEVDEFAAEEFLNEINKNVPDEETSEVISSSIVHIHRRTKRKSKKLVRLIIMLIVSLIVLCGLVAILVVGINNNYKTPVRIYEEYMNLESYSDEDLSYAYGNGLGEEGLRNLRNRLRDSYEYITDVDNTVIKNELEYQQRCREYGDDYKLSVSIEDMKPIGTNELKAYALDFDSIVEDLSNSSLSNSDSVTRALALTEATEEIRRAKVTKGYKLSCVEVITGSKLSEPKTRNMTMTVVKINGRWVLWDEIYTILRISY